MSKSADSWNGALSSDRFKVVYTKVGAIGSCVIHVIARDLHPEIRTAMWSGHL
jgi:hypothetical protein